MRCRKLENLVPKCCAPASRSKMQLAQSSNMQRSMHPETLFKMDMLLVSGSAKAVLCRMGAVEIQWVLDSPLKVKLIIIIHP